MKKSSWPLMAMIFIGLLQVVSCTKSIDTDSGSIGLATADNLTFPTTSEFASCKLRRIVHADIAQDTLVNGLFTYNAAGNPYSLTYGRQAGSGNPNHYFFYDKQHQLREYQITSAPNVVTEEPWHRYGYNASNQIIVDTTLYPYFQNEDGSVTFGRVYVSDLTYDGQGRIIKESIRELTNPAAPIRNPTYTYDSRGNLAVAGWKSSSYDYNKPSIFRTHPVFQFIHRNYSVNNAAVQPKYNSKGLPLSNAPSNDQFFNAYPTLIGSSGVAKAIYDCN